MNVELKETYAKLLAYIIKIDNEVTSKETNLFCSLMDEHFGCDQEEAHEFLKTTSVSDEEAQECIEQINKELGKNSLEKMHLLEEINHIIYSDGIEENEYEAFEKIKGLLFPNV